MRNLLENIDEKRYKSAMTAELTPLSIDTSTKSGRFVGSTGEIYDTTLCSCTCMDFEFNNETLACKHILRLAMELNLIPNDGMVSDVQKAYAKYYLGVLKTFAKTAPLMEAMHLTFITLDLLKSSGYSCQNDILSFAGVPDLLNSGLFELTKKEKIKIKKNYKKDFSSIRKAVEARVGEFIIEHIDYKPLFDVLKDMTKEKLDAHL